MERKGLTPMQWLLRPVLNFLVKQYFPSGAFFGHDYLRQFDRVGHPRIGPITAGSAFAYLSSYITDEYSTEGVLTQTGLTVNGKDVGDWVTIVRQINPPKTEKAEDQ